ncbi:Filamentous growth regulator 27 [Tolypocladium capitatum]|uniref:Filamentous growth regulator 27 n=1 Tax=Tolypocladium capitatum TaxID=45235 RepID=A0A2K3QDJ7_9HYPO|nr:Filamentous growth regulator 27 [Tolypocladium capitatum]
MQLEHGDRRPPQRLPVNPRRHKVAPDRRKRVATAWDADVLSCNNCNVRRIKCSGDRPCNRCASTARDCVYPTPVEMVSVPKTELDGLRKKVEVYERALVDALPDPILLQELLHHAANPDCCYSSSSSSSSSASPFAASNAAGAGSISSNQQLSGASSVKTELADAQVMYGEDEWDKASQGMIWSGGLVYSMDLTML